jgi:hypothetical protein
MRRLPCVDASAHQEDGLDNGQERPRAGDPPQLDSPIEILRELLRVERARLQVALRIEDERNIVFPETTVIIRDIERITFEIERRGDESIHAVTEKPIPKRTGRIWKK